MADRDRWGGAPPSDADIIWPRITPKSPSACPVTPLGKRDGSIFAVDNVLTHAEAAALVAATDPHFVHQGSRGPAAGEALRSCGRCSVIDHAFARMLWKAVAPAITPGLPPRERGAAVGLNPNIRAYRYDRGDAFKPHYDDDEVVDGMGVTRYTLLLYLSACRGGETVFYAGGRGRSVVASVAPAPGRALLHRHGGACLPHEGARVDGGVKYVLRSDVVFTNTATG